jgi:hypothetical protein
MLCGLENKNTLCCLDFIKHIELRWCWSLLPLMNFPNILEFLAWCDANIMVDGYQEECSLN